MISIGRLSNATAAADYYLQRQADCQADHYTGVGLDTRSLYADVGLSLDNALAHLDELIDVRRPCFDVVFSAPQSVSVVYGLGGEDMSREVREAQANAEQQAMDYLTLLVARSVQGHHGDGRSASRVATDGLAAAAFEQRSSRADDPQLHTHVVIANLIRRADGQWTVLDSAALVAGRVQMQEIVPGRRAGRRRAQGRGRSDPATQMPSADFRSVHVVRVSL